jgi:ribonuclease HI
MIPRPLLITVFSDASVSGNEAGCGWWFKSEFTKRSGAMSLTREGIQSNEAELWGIFNAITAAVGYHSQQVDIVLQCDSLSALQALHTKGHRWAKTSKLKGGPRRKMSPFEQSLADRISNLPTIENIYLKHVKGHTGRSDSRSFVNHLTDQLASSARKMANKEGKAA